MANKDGYTFVSVRLDQEGIDILDKLVAGDTEAIGLKMDRSKFIKRLIAKEYQRRLESGLVITEMAAPEDTKGPVLIGSQPGSNGNGKA
jgi:hypothetical protein